MIRNVVTISKETEKRKNAPRSRKRKAARRTQVVKEPVAEKITLQSFFDAMLKKGPFVREYGSYSGSNISERFKTWTIFENARKANGVAILGKKLALKSIVFNAAAVNPRASQRFAIEICACTNPVSAVITVRTFEFFARDDDGTENARIAKALELSFAVTSVLIPIADVKTARFAENGCAFSMTFVFGKRSFIRGSIALD